MTLLDLQAARDEKLSAQVRPHSIEEFVGQEKAVRLLEVMTKSDGVTSDSVLMVGPPGTGKTTLARLTSPKLRTLIGSRVDDIDIFIFTLRSIKEDEVLFIDEIHALRRKFGEMLYTVMEDGVVSTMLGEVSVRGEIVGATTDPGKIPEPLRDRFGQIIRLTLYTDEEIARILKRSGGIIGLRRLTDSKLGDIAGRSRGVPRIANRLLRRIRDFGLDVTRDLLTEVWDVLGVDKYGLEDLDHDVLRILAMSERPVGAARLARAVGLDRAGLEAMVEPYLMRRGYMEIAPGGRIITDQGRLIVAGS